jgi:hypothetical protein
MPGNRVRIARRIDVSLDAVKSIDIWHTHDGKSISHLAINYIGGEMTYLDGFDAVMLDALVRRIVDPRMVAWSVIEGDGKRTYFLHNCICIDYSFDTNDDGSATAFATWADGDMVLFVGTVGAGIFAGMKRGLVYDALPDEVLRAEYEAAYRTTPDPIMSPGPVESDGLDPLNDPGTPLGSPLRRPESD